MKRLWLITLLTTMAVILFIFSLYYFHAGFLDSIEARSYDFRYKVVRGAEEPDPRIAIIALDEKSIKELGRFPWSREVYVPLLDNLKKAGAKAVLFDAFYPEVQDEKIDQQFADAIVRSGIVTLATAFDFAADWGITHQTISIPKLTEAAKNTAHINFLPDEDGVNRWNLLIIPYDEWPYPSLGLIGAMEAMDLTIEDLDGDDFSLFLGDLVVPVDMLGRMLVNYTGPPGIYETFSFSDIAMGRVPDEKLKGRILFLGATALGIYDMRETPFHPNTPGVEVHAAVADNILRGNFISKGDFETLLDLLLILFPALIVYFVNLKYKPIVTLPITVGLLFGVFFFVNFMFSQGSWVSIVYPMLSIGATYALIAYLKFYLSDKKAREMRNIFSSYVSKKVVDELVLRPEAAKIGGDKKDISLLFSDVKGYTSYSEKRSPEEVVKTLNEYLGAMSSVIIDMDGTLDKFLGDGIMAYWGAPLAQDNHHEQALRCALAQIKRLNELIEKWEAEGTEPFSIRIGLNSGKVIAGNIGAVGKKMEYTVIGDNVNLASRLESSAKAYGVTILASEYIYEPTKDKFLFRELDYIRVVGKTQPIRVYEVIQALDEPMDEASEAIVEKFHNALKFYRDKNFKEALAIFVSLRDEADDAASQVYIERCESFISTPPPGDWDGVFVRTSK
jgi:adenylate cyclase